MKHEFVVAFLALCAGVVTGFVCRNPYLPQLTVIVNKDIQDNWVPKIELKLVGYDATTAYPENVLRITTECKEGIEFCYRDERCVAIDYHNLPKLGFYKCHAMPESWFKASAICEQENAHLLVLNSEEEFNAIKEILETSMMEGAYIHIGLNDIDREGEFVTAQAEPIANSGYVKWGYEEPLRNATVNCVALDIEGRFYNIQCSRKLPFCCEGEIQCD
ncbi:hemolymph lipopolysaccharide-binding protein-like [Periplaneta americana]|uniref:hemolymph lipopolysaccharide-binding protein-like n=1 Tax=Periplaneta americana TaxID=6978 RepID=UPI0037E84103